MASNFHEAHRLAKLSWGAWACSVGCNLPLTATFGDGGQPLGMASKWCLLAVCFPTLRMHDIPGLNPNWADPKGFNPNEFDEWLAANKGEIGHGLLAAGRFMLSIFNSHVEWKCGAFNMREAWGDWDEEHRAVWSMWATNPWFA